jgi:DNA-binding transcriptional MocR family regulator
MASSLNAALVSRWIEDGTASAMRNAISREAAERQAIMKGLLVNVSRDADPRAFHFWLRLPNGWSRASFAEQLRAEGISVALSDAFSVGAAPEAVRLSLGGPVTRSQLKYGLERIALLLSTGPSFSSVII